MECHIVIKEERQDLPPGFSSQPEVSYGGATVSSSTAGDQSDGPYPFEINSVPMQNSIECCFIQQDSASATNSGENFLKRKTRAKEFSGHETYPFSRRRQPGALQPPRQAQGSDSPFDFNPTIDVIKAKHGDIDKDCNLKSEWMRKLNLFGICNVLKELQTKRLDELDIVCLEPYYEVVRDLERLNINVVWLFERLDKIKDAIRSRDKAKVFNDEKNALVKTMEEKKKEMKRLKHEIENLEDQVAKENLIIEQLKKDISTHTYKFQEFQRSLLTNGLI